jgi:hypothetical protein
VLQRRSCAVHFCTTFCCLSLKIWKDAIRSDSIKLRPRHFEEAAVLLRSADNTAKLALHGEQETINPEEVSCEREGAVFFRFSGDTEGIYLLRRRQGLRDVTPSSEQSAAAEIYRSLIASKKLKDQSGPSHNPASPCGH